MSATVRFSCCDPTAYIEYGIPEQVVRRDGRLMWRSVERGPRGGSYVLWTSRLPGETVPSPWAIWSRRARDVGHLDRVVQGV